MKTNHIKDLQGVGRAVLLGKLIVLNSHTINDLNFHQ